MRTKKRPQEKKEERHRRDHVAHHGEDHDGHAPEVADDQAHQDDECAVAPPSSPCHPAGTCDEEEIAGLHEQHRGLEASTVRGIPAAGGFEKEELGDAQRMVE